MSTALVAGGAGFLGSHLAKKLLDEGYQVVVIDSLITGDERNIKDFFSNPNFSFIQGDISQDIILKNKKIDLIFHLASPASPPKYMKFPHETIRANIHGTINLIELTKKYNSKLIFASTSEIYGDPEVSPQNESYWGNVNSIGPRSVYDEAKRLGETLCSQALREGVKTGIVRIFNTYGPNMDPYDGRVVSTFIRQAIQKEAFTVQGTGEQTRSFCFFSDLVEGIFKFSQLDHFGPINLGNPKEFSILELIDIIASSLKVSANITFVHALEDDPKQRKPDINKAINLLNWKPKIELHNGILATHKWMKKILS